MTETEENENQIYCINCGEDKQMVLRGIERLQSHDKESLWLVSWQCPTCLTCQSHTVKRGATLLQKNVEDWLKENFILLDKAPDKKVHNSDRVLWCYNWSNELGHYDFSRKRKVRAMDGYTL